MRNLFALVLITTTFIINAQTIEREVVSANGEFYSNSAGQISTTLGEPIIATTNNGANTLTQGFQQTKITVTSVEDFKLDFVMNVYPNPVSSFVTIKMDALKENIHLSIYTIEGKELLNNQLTELETKLNIESFAKGNYFLNITENNNIIKTYKIIKQ
jgi:Secretion system C-terminal sorting domain